MTTSPRPATGMQVSLGLLAYAVAAIAWPEHLFEVFLMLGASLGLLLSPGIDLVWCPFNLLPCVLLATTGLIGTWTCGAELRPLATEWLFACLWYWTICNGLRQPGGLRAVRAGIVVAALVFAGWAAMDVARGDYRAAGPTLHPNMLGSWPTSGFPSCCWTTTRPCQSGCVGLGSERAPHWL